MKRLFLLLALLAGCGGPLSGYRLPGQDLAERDVWRATYGMVVDPPAVRWRSGSDLNCSWGGDRYLGFHLEDGTCASGVDYCVGRQVEAAYPYANRPFSQTSYAHELNHQRMWDQYGTIDPMHSDPSWAPGGLVDQADAALAADGL